MAPKVAVRDPEEQLADHEWTKKWTLPQNGRSQRPAVTFDRNPPNSETGFDSSYPLSRSRSFCSAFKPEHFANRIIPPSKGCAYLCSSAARFRDHGRGLVQFWSFRPGMRLNSRSLFVTRVSPADLAWAAIQRSLPPIISPRASSAARISP